jgi:hypothetical protein
MIRISALIGWCVQIAMSLAGQLICHSGQTAHAWPSRRAGRGSLISIDAHRLTDARAFFRVCFSAFLKRSLAWIAPPSDVASIAAMSLPVSADIEN